MLSALHQKYTFAPKNCIVILDNLDLEPGRLRLKFGGSGSHNGLRSLCENGLKSGFWRLFVGIGHPDNARLDQPENEDLGHTEPVESYVLRKPEQAGPHADAIGRAQQALMQIVCGTPPEELIGQVNRKNSSRFIMGQGRRQALLETLQSKVRELAPGPLVVAVSGGLDSVALLHLLCHTAEPRKNPLYPCYIYHGIRKEHPEAEALPEYCRTLGLTLRTFRIQDGWLAEKAHQRGMSLEDLARYHRYQRLEHYLLSLSGHHSVSAWSGCLVLAHHADDQAENLLMSLNRGAGLGALAGMREWQCRRAKGPPTKKVGQQKIAQIAQTGQQTLPKTGYIKIWRPLLDWERGDLQRWAELHNVPHWEDRSNFDQNAMRSFYRWQVLPQLKRSLPGLVQGLRRTQRQLMMHEDALEQQRSELRAQLVSSPFSIAWNGLLDELPAPLQIELLFLLFDELHRGCHLAQNRLPMRFCTELLRQWQNHRNKRRKRCFEMHAHGCVWQLALNWVCVQTKI